MSKSGLYPWTTRRRFMLRVLAAAAAAQTGACADHGGGGTADATDSGSSGNATDTPTGEPVPALPGDPFTLGVASGDPLPGSVILWTRLAPSPLEDGGGMPVAIYTVQWEVGADEAFTDIVASGSADTDPTYAHSLHIDATGLKADSWYWYRFKIEDYVSPVGRTRTTPAIDAKPGRLRFATACCQSYTDGYYTAHAHLAQEAIDLVFFLGDYIYEDPATGPVRSHAGVEAKTLDEYRARYALYKSDPLLQAVHTRCPWVFLWDDHEVDDNYAGAVSADNLPGDEFLARRAAAYQAFYEHLPLRLPPPGGADYKIYHALQWGDLAEFWLVDTRQYRSDQNCMDKLGAGCAGWDTYDGTLLGDEQEAWLKQGMTTSKALWKVLTNQVVFSPVSFGGTLVNFDQWDGYPVARQRLLDFITTAKLENVVILSGDLHVGGVAEVGAVAVDDASPVAAVEIVTTSSSAAPDQVAVDAEKLVQSLKRVRYFNAHDRGYVTSELTRTQWKIQSFMVETVAQPSSPGAVQSELFIDIGVPGLRPA